MHPWKIALAAWLLSPVTAYATPLLLDSGTVQPAPMHPAVIADYAVTPNIRGLAENAVRDKPDAIVVTRPGRPPLWLAQRRFAPRNGFTFDENGGVMLDPAAHTDALDYSVYAVGHGIELSMHVFRGRMTGSLTGMLGKHEEAWSLVEANGRIVWREYDLSQVVLEPELPYDTPPLPSLAEKRRVDGGGTIDLLVVHALNAIPLIGSQSAMDALIRDSLEDMRIALENSQAFRVRINHLHPGGAASLPLQYAELAVTGTAYNRWLAHRTWARTSAEVTQLRDLHQADLVLMMVGDVGMCGIAYTQRPNCGGDPEDGCEVGQAYAGFAFSVTSTGPECGLPTRTIAHELGHQLGLEHDRPNGIQNAVEASFPWSHGFAVSTPAAQARTIMAYATTCTWGCPTQLQYSNPAVTFQSLPGVLSGTNATDTKGRSTANARTTVLLAEGISRFRGPTMPHVLFGHGFEALPEFHCNPNQWPNCPP